MSQGMSVRERQPSPWRCPQEIEHLGLTVLYQAVACWALLKARPVTVGEVSHVFAIPERRACDVLHYITHDAGMKVTADTRMVHGPEGRRKAVHVREVDMAWLHQGKRVSVPEKRKKRVDDNRNIQQLRTWFLSRRPGEGVPVGAETASRDEG
ncbi:hypothetical protein B0T92_20580 [Salmonella enterica]|nr:hypothetical protein [Salmonella enterica]EAY0054863.1 hypothetical protein [Salmonella enterica]EHF1887944.1 hypothetical protein [Salmonella enterica]EHF3222007.1 hypothetical protein [Salmonella enterica subsp. houtenae serovar Houten]